MAGRNRLCFGLFFALLAISLDFRLNFAMPLQQESSQLESDASGDSVDNSSDSSPETVEVPDDVEDAVEAGGDIDDASANSKDSPNKQTANTVNPPAELATSSEDASASSSDSSSTNIGKDTENTQPGSETQSTTAQANQRSDTMSAQTQHKTLAQANQPYEAAQQSDQSTYKFLNGDGDVETVSKNDDENENNEEDSDQTSTFDDSERTISSKTDKQSSNYQFNDHQQKVKQPVGKGTAYQFLNANGRIESVEKSELLAENEEKPKTLNYASQTQDENIVNKVQNTPSFLESVSNDQSVSEQTPQNPAGESPSAPVQTTPTQGALNTNFAGKTQSAPEPAVQNQASQNVQFTAADQVATSPAPNVVVQSQNTQVPNQFVNPNQNTEKLSYSHQPNSSPSPSFEFADQRKTSDNLNYAEHDDAPQNTNYADQSQATQNYVDQSQSAPSANQFVDQRQQQTPQNAYYADQSQSLPNSADQSQSFPQGTSINNQEPSSFREIVCKGVNKRISCDSGQQINILNADYGSMGQSECKFNDAAPSSMSTCQTPGTYEAVRAKCDGQQNCDLTAADQEFGDQCPGDDKYLDVNYGCAAASAPAPQPYYPQPGLSPYQQQAPAIPNLMTSNAYQQQAPAIPNLMTSNAYSAPAAPNPCDPCNACNMCAMSQCSSQCHSTCQPLQCGLIPPRLPASLLPLWQQWDDKTADMNSMEMSALIMSPVPKLPPAKKPDKGSKEAGSSSDQDSEKRSKISKEPSKTIKIKFASSTAIKKPAKATKKSLHPSELHGFQQNDSSQSKDTGSGMLESEISPGFLTSNDFAPGSGDTASGSTQ